MTHLMFRVIFRKLNKSVNKETRVLLAKIKVKQFISKRLNVKWEILSPAFFIKIFLIQIRSSIIKFTYQIWNLMKRKLLRTSFGHFKTIQYHRTKNKYKKWVKSLLKVHYSCQEKWPKSSDFDMVLIFVSYMTTFSHKLSRLNNLCNKTKSKW